LRVALDTAPADALRVGAVPGATTRAVPSASSRVRWARAVPSAEDDAGEARAHDEERSRPSSPSFDLGAAADQLTNREAADLVRQMLGSMADEDERVQLLFCALQCVLEVEVEKVPPDERGWRPLSALMASIISSDGLHHQL
jgi:hypothetical protein